VVGIAGDTRSQRYNALRWDRYPILYTAFAQRAQPKRQYASAPTLYITLRGGSALNRSIVANSVDELDPSVPVGNFQATGEIVSSLTSQPRMRAAIFAAFGIMAMLLAALGIYGLMLQNVEQRRREIGIRMALGAIRNQIVRLVLSRALALGLTGVLIGTAAAVAMTRVLGAFVYGVSALNAAIFVAAAGLLVLIAVLASYLPARRASSIDPAVVLRSE
jgi:ABC-type antimicrobial peptide transport system permease subunit